MRDPLMERWLELERKNEFNKKELKTIIDGCKKTLSRLGYGANKNTVVTRAELLVKARAKMTEIFGEWVDK